MLDAIEMVERHAAQLARVAAAAERLALKHAERALDADDPETEARATTAFNRAARAMRQCQALEARLRREAQAADRADLRRADLAYVAEREHRKAQIRATATHLVNNEAGSESDAEKLCDELDDLLDVEALTDGFLDQDLTGQIARICQALGLTHIEVLAVLPDTPPPDTAGGGGSPRRRGEREGVSHGSPAPHRCHPGKRAALVRDP